MRGRTRYGQGGAWVVAALLAVGGVTAQPPPAPGQPAYDLRTQIPPITAERWTTETAAPTRARITREDYLAYIARTYEKQRQAAWQTAGSPEANYQYLHARKEAFWYRVERNEERAKLAMRFIQGDYLFRTQGKGKDTQVGFNIIVPAVEAYVWIMNSPSLTKADHQLVANWLATLEAKNAGFEVGAMNRSMGWATGRMMLTKLYPQDPANAARKTYFDQVWNDWWPLRDTDENAEGYNALWLTYLASWLEAAQEEDKYQDPAVKALIYRYMEQATPMGVLPHYGDECGWNNDPATWVALMEKWASVYKDGRWKWLAHRIWEYTAPQDEQMWQWGNINYNTMEGLMGAYLWAEESIAEKQPESRSVVSTRKGVSWASREDRQASGYFMRLTDQVLPNKLVFRDGWEPGSTFAQVELCPPMGHGHGDAGGISCYVSQGSVLLEDTPYLVKDQAFHNCFVVKPDPLPPVGTKWDGAGIANAQQTTVEDFVSWPQAAYARVHMTGYMAQPVTVDRRLWFLGEAGMWVQDTVEANQPYAGRIGPAWQTLAAYGTYGANWGNTCLPTIPVAYIWEQKYMMQWLNRPWDLLVYFLPGTDCRLVGDDVTQDNTNHIVDKPIWNNFKLRMWYQKTTQLQPGQPQRFGTVLLPHKPVADATPLAAGIKVLRDQPGCQVLKLTATDGTVRYVGINERGDKVPFEGMVTDARRFLVVKKGEEKPQFYLAEATLLGTEGETLFTATERKSTPEPLSGKPAF